MSAEVIESLGGIRDTIKPLQETFKQHELRPYQVLYDYKDHIKHLKSTPYSDLCVSNKMAADGKAMIVSASPYRAHVKLDPSNRGSPKESDSESDEEFARELDTVNESMRRRHVSPIRGDSEKLRT